MLRLGLDDPVLIAGAGICGLVIAHGLQEVNIPFFIFDAEDELTACSEDWPMALQWSMPLLKSLLPKDLTDRLETHAAVETSLGYNPGNKTACVSYGAANELSGEINPDSDYLGVSKAKLRALCHEGIYVKYGQALQDIEWTDQGNVAAIFANGDRLVGSTLIGADGAHSTVRKILFGREKAQLNPIDTTYVNASFRYSDAQKAQFIRNAVSSSSVSAHNGCTACISIISVPDSERPETWQFHLSMGWKDELDKSKRRRSLSNHKRLQEVKAKAGALNEPFSSAVLWIPDDVEIQYSDLGTWTPTPWHTRGGRVTLAGDAAHSMAPNSNGGLDNAIADAYNLVDALKGVVAGNRVRAEAIPSYSREVVARGEKAVKLSRETADSILDNASLTENGFLLRESAMASTNSNNRSKRRSRLLFGQMEGQRAMNLRKAWSNTRLWMTNSIENLDRGAKQGTAQTGWVALGRREYARRNFPAD